MLVSPPPALSGAAARAAALGPWRRRALLTLLGIVSAASLPPLHLVPVLWLAFPALFWLMEADRRPGPTFAAAWFFGLGHFAAGLYWISHALLIDPLQHGWMIPFAVGGLGAMFGVFVGLAALLARFAPAGVPRVLCFAGAWTIGEWVRSWLFTGFAWNLIATVWTPVESVLQTASVVGAYGLGMLTVAVAAMPAVLLHLPKRRGALAIGASLMALAALALAGTARLRPAEMVPDVTLRLVQPALDQKLKWRPDLRAAHLRNAIVLSREPGFEGITHVIWPETAVPFFLDIDAEARAAAAVAAPPGGALIAGVDRRSPVGEEPLRIWNSIMVIDSGATVRATYDKSHLVPFGEYVPLRDTLPDWIAKITPGSIDFSAGAGPASLAVPGAPAFAPLICYEVIFPAAVVAPGERPQWIVNVTNDAWFGLSAGPYQHFASARMRAVEEGLPLARAANTGVSGVIDPYGRVVAMLGLGHRGIVDSPLPRALPPTLFARVGNPLPLSMAAMTLVACFAIRRRTESH